MNVRFTVIELFIVINYNDRNHFNKLKKHAFLLEICHPKEAKWKIMFFSSLHEITKLTFFTLSIEFYSISVYPQLINEYYNYPKQITLKINAPATEIKIKKRFWWASAELATVQVTAWATNRYVRKQEFAHITFSSIQNNINPRTWKWDDNTFINNHLAHPYQGGLYFNAFRSNGYTFTESSLAALFGSYTWETLCETHPPAPNDLINTTLGGIVFGEVSNRISKVILRNKHGKGKGIILEPVAFIINPMQGINRISSPAWAKKYDSAVRDETPASLLAEGGLRVISRKRNNLTNPEPFGRIHIQYGSPYTHLNNPFSNFSLVTEFGNEDSANANIIQMEGAVFGKKITQTRQSLHIMNLSINYDYYKNSSFVNSSQSLRFNILSRFDLFKTLQLNVKAGAGPITLAALPNKYMYVGEGRNYDYGLGLSYHFSTCITLANRIYYYFNFTGGRAVTVDGFESTHLFNNRVSALRVEIYKDISISATSNNYSFNGNYKSYPLMEETFFFRYFGLGYKISL